MSAEAPIYLVTDNPKKRAIAQTEWSGALEMMTPAFDEDRIKAELQDNPGPDEALIYVLAISQAKARGQGSKLRQEGGISHAKTLIVSDSIVAIEDENESLQAINRDELQSDESVRRRLLDALNRSRQLLFVGCVSSISSTGGPVASAMTYYRATVPDGVAIVDTPLTPGAVTLPVPIESLSEWPWEVGFIDPSKIGTALDPFIPCSPQPQTFDSEAGNMARPYISGLLGEAIRAVVSAVQGEHNSKTGRIPVLISVE